MTATERASLTSSPATPPRELPLLRLAPAPTPIAWRAGGAIDRRRFLGDARRAAARLPPSRYVVNLCDDRYNFMVGFAGAAIAGRTTLLPASRMEADLTRTAGDYPGSHRLTDAEVAAWLAADVTGGGEAMPLIDGDLVAAIAFTSGSTGRAVAHPKRWRELVAGAVLAERRFGFEAMAGAVVVATTPPQHMYGLETSILLPLATSLAAFAGRPFFPADIDAALRAVPAPRVLVTTPAHLRVCVGAGIAWPPLALVISATAPLSADLAARAEDVFAASVMEIYGFTEAGSVASRRTLDGDVWTLYDGMRIVDDTLHARHLPAGIALADIVETCGPTRFRLLGRKQDLVNVAGKRTSLAFLNQQLTAIDGVDDGIFVAAPDAADGPTRLLALVVAPGSSTREILAALARRIDPLFLPRPLVKVDRLPRNDVGKLRREDVQTLIRQFRDPAGQAADG
jgi:acyl-coenzyme A synthetase/AMP-(fatty) acid ligase